MRLQIEDDSVWNPYAKHEETIESLRRELENERARDIHSCRPDCTRSGCVNRRLREELAEARQEIADRKADCETGHDQDEATIAELRHQIADKDAEIERLKSQLKSQALDCLAADGQAMESWTQLAAGQAREQQLREMFSCVARPMGVNEHPNDYAAKARLTAIRALQLPQDTAALSAMITKAGEVMRERSKAYLSKANSQWHAEQMIRALPAVTLDDLKGGA